MPTPKQIFFSKNIDNAFLLNVHNRKDDKRRKGNMSLDSLSYQTLKYDMSQKNMALL